MDVTSIVSIGRGEREPYVPSLSDYKAASSQWTEAEFHCLDVNTSHVRVGYWSGEPGHVVLDPWIYTEVCSILTGRVAVEDEAGGRREYGPGEGFVIPKGFVGKWVTLESATKIFLAIY
jgi:uncharacterized cupin superfamily protein